MLRFYRIKLFLIFLINILLINKITSQNIEPGTPFIRNYTPKEYGYESLNSSVMQDKRGIFYFGNFNGILEYDGTTWHVIKVKGYSSLAIDRQGVVYVGGYNEFGYLSSDEKNKTVYISLTDKMISKDFGQIMGVKEYHNEIFFYTQKKLFRWDGRSIELIDETDTYLKIFKVGERLLVYNHEDGIKEYSNKKFQEGPKGELFIGKNVIDILPYNDKFLIKTASTRGFYICNIDTLYYFNTQADEFLYQNDYMKGIELSNGNYAIGTGRCGIIVIDKEGNFVNNINKQNGLNDDGVYDLYIDAHNNLWAALSNGICRIEMPSAFTFFDKNSGIRGSIQSIARNNNNIYVATNHGVFYYPQGSLYSNNISCGGRKKFLPIDGARFLCNNLLTYNDQLYAFTSEGILHIKNDKAKLIFKEQVLAVHRSSIDKSVIFLGIKEGVVVLSQKDTTWTELGFYKIPNTEIKTIAQDKNGVVWVGTYYDGVYKIDLSRGFEEKANAIQFKSSAAGFPNNHEWIDVYSTANGMLFSTDQGLYRFNKDIFKFELDTLIGIDFSKGDKWVYPIVEDEYGNLLMSYGFQDKYNKVTLVAYYNGRNRKYKLDSTLFKNISEYTIETIYPDKGSVVWFGSQDGLFRFDQKGTYTDTSSFRTLIRNISIGKDSVIYLGGYFYTDTIPREFSYKNNTIKFKFSVPVTKGEDKALYQCFLKGFDKDWTDWNPSSHKEYTNLPEGDYIFRVRAKNLFDRVSEESSFSFTVTPPIYRTWIAYIFYGILMLSFSIMILRWREYVFVREKHIMDKIIKEKTEDLVIQKERAEELVANILPKDTAQELQSKGKVTRKKYKMATVLFSDIQGFTQIAEHMNPEILLDELDKFFFYFDKVVERLNIEKIKTIGDAYMCAGGIPQKNRTNPVDVVMAALEVKNYLAELRKEFQYGWDIRIGIHSGPVIAGVVGSKKLSYDIWGDTVNIASRMESTSLIGEINISDLTYSLVKDFYDCTYRGRMPVKYKGDIDMYFVKGIKAELSIDGEGKKPNKEFLRKLQHIRFDDLDELMMTKLEEGLPKNLYYHNLKHTIDIITQVELIGREEGVSKEELLLLKTAALFHDAGFLIGYDDHELLSIKMAKDILPDFYYTDEQIKIISDLIYVTQRPPKPKNLLEEIMCDADLDYLGRNDFIPVSQKLFQELFEHKKIKTIDEWNKMQIKFIEGHHYFTKTARKLRDVNKNVQLDKLKKLVSS